MKLNGNAIIEYASDAILVLDLNGRIQYLNRSAENLYGFYLDELKDKHISVLQPAHFSGEFETVYTHFSSGNTIGPIESERLTAQNNIIRVSSCYSAVRGDMGNLVSISCIDRKIIGKEVIAENARALLETAPDAMVIVNSEGQIVFTNHQTNRFFGFTQEELAGKKVEVLMPDRYTDQHNKYVKAFFEQPNVRAMGHGLELFGKRKDGTEFPVEISLSPLQTREGIFVSAAIRDITDRKLSDTRMKSLLQRIHLATHAINLGIWEVDFLTGEIEWDENMYRLFDMPEGVSIDQENWVSFIHPDDTSRIMNAYNESIDKKVPEIEFELRVITVKQNEKYLKSKMLLQVDESGNVAKAVGVSWDKTVQLKSTYALQESERKMGIVLRSTKERIYLLDRHGRIILMNDEAKKVIQKLRHDLPPVSEGDLLLDITPPELKQKVTNAINAALNGEQVEYEASSIIDGSEQWFIHFFTPARSIDNKIDGVALISLDITKRKQAEISQHALLQSTKEGIYLYDTSLKLVLINEQGQRFARMRSGIHANIGQHVTEITREDEIDGILKILNKVLEGHPYEMERNISSEDGSLWLQLSYNPVKEKDKIIGVCLVARDVTELVHSRENLVSARQRAEQSERLQEQFLANMSHEIRTPLNGIVGMSNLLLSTHLNEQQQEFLKTVIHSSDTLLFLINDILDLSKIKAGKFRIEKIQMDIYKIIEELTIPLRIKANEKGIRFSAMMDPATPRDVYGDPHRLIQILNNLLSNAIKFTASGYVKLEVELVEKTSSSAIVNLVVSDSGIGIDENQLGLIFESFAQEGSDTARKFGGTGLGLTITKRLVELQDGTISVTSEKGKGSRFQVTIPYQLLGENESIHKAESAPASAINTRPDFTGKRVLVAEDNEVNQQVIRHLLKDYGLEVSLVADGKQAIDKLEESPSYDLVILDLRMPVMDGFQALTYIRQKMQLKVPIIVLTASVLRDERDRCLELGANDYQAKPFSRPVLVQCLTRLLGERSGA